MCQSIEARCAIQRQGGAQSSTSGGQCQLPASVSSVSHPSELPGCGSVHVTYQRELFLCRIGHGMERREDIVLRINQFLTPTCEL